MDEEAEMALIERTLELLAEAIDDITPLVYENFFALRPEAAELFDEDSQMSCGRMLNEIFACLVDQAGEEINLEGVYQAHTADHAGFGVRDMSMYKDFLNVLQSTIADVLGQNWPQDAKAAFERQCDLMYEKMLNAGESLVEQRLMHIPGPKLRVFAEK
jgi:hemoglobin-like flavoprotein